MTNVPHNRKSIRRNEVKKKYEHQIEFDMEKVANAAHKPQQKHRVLHLDDFVENTKKKLEKNGEQLDYFLTLETF